jgi:2-oxoglutarate ferredoxin oxidoreductase subunit alpha
MNLGQLSLLLRARYLVDVVGYNHVRGLPLKAAELAEAITQLIEQTGEQHPDQPPGEQSGQGSGSPNGHAANGSHAGTRKETVR